MKIISYKFASRLPRYHVTSAKPPNSKKQRKEDCREQHQNEDNTNICLINSK